MDFWKYKLKCDEDDEESNYYHNLCNYSIEKCELCDKVFSSRFANIIHNADHIIIPLQKQKVFKCKICLFCFTSVYELRTHMKNKHNEKKQVSEKVKNATKNVAAENITENISDKDPITIKLKPTKENLKSDNSATNGDDLNCTNKNTNKKGSQPKKLEEKSTDKTSKKVERYKPPIQFEESSLSDESPLDTMIYRNIHILGSKPRSTPYDHHTSAAIPPIIQCNQNKQSPELPSTSTQNQPSLLKPNTGREPSPASIVSDFSYMSDIPNNNPGLGEGSISDEVEPDDFLVKRDLHRSSSPVVVKNIPSLFQYEEDKNCLLQLLDQELNRLSYEFKIVHNDELLEPKFTECKWCHTYFGNRMDLYKHEADHIKLKPLSHNKYFICNICNKYYSGNHLSKRKHFNTYHPGVDENKKPTNICKICKVADLQFGTKEMHYKMHHPNLFCDSCNKCFAREMTVVTHKCRADQSKPATAKTKPAVETLKVCDLCFSFTKNTQNFKYELVGEKSELGKRQKCFYCQKVYFVVKLVRRYNLMVRKLHKKKEHENSNKAKLDKLRKRFKAIKGLNK